MVRESIGETMRATGAGGLAWSNKIRVVALWVAVAVVMGSVVVAAEMPAPYKYESPPPYKYETPSPPEYKAPPLPENCPPPPAYKYESPTTPPYKHESPTPYHDELKAVVTGSVYCDVCQNGKIKKPLKDVKVGVFCWNGESEDAFYGTTEEKGKFKIELTGFDYEKWGGKACQAKPVWVFYETSCTIPTELHGELHIKSKSEKEVVLMAGPFVYKSEKKFEKCRNHDEVSPPYKHESPSTPPYKYQSPPYKYKSPPPPPYN